MAASVQFHTSYRAGLAQFVGYWFGVPTPRPEYQVIAPPRSYAIASPERSYAAVSPFREYKVKT